VKSTPKSLEQSRVTCVPDRIAFGIRAGWDNETEGRREQDEGAKGHVRRPPSFHSADLRVGDARRVLERPLAQTGSDARTPELATERAESLVGQAVGSIVSTLTRGHLPTSWKRSLACRFTRSRDSHTPPSSSGRGSPDVPNVGGLIPPTTESTSFAQLAARLARPTNQQAGGDALRRRLARPTNQQAGGDALRRRLARPTNQQAGGDALRRRLAIPTN
jgi:hypothetical protein